MTLNIDSPVLVSALLSRIEHAEISQDPFPHLVLHDAFPDEDYHRVLASLRTARFAAAEYPGTGRFTVRHGGQPSTGQDRHHHGLVIENWDCSPDVAALHALFSGDAFARTLLSRFADPASRGGRGPAIPVEKHALFASGAQGYKCVFSVHKDLEHYEISPHVDHPGKLVTFLWYLDDDWSQPCETLLCRPKPGVDVSSLALDYEAARREGRSGLWMDWEHFEVVKKVAGPNVFLAFAPNDISYHGVRKQPGTAVRERTVLRGFVSRRGYKDTRLVASSSSTDSDSLSSVQ